VKTTVTVSKAQSQFPSLCRRKETTSVTRRGEVVAFIVPKTRMLDLLEQMEILANPAAMKAVERARRGKGKNHPLSALDED
jgi:antitoxin (DNA-binding transcriptional repressor) of toxin-antitoxin stability system